jgi:hypothetical protein
MNVPAATVIATRSPGIRRLAILGVGVTLTMLAAPAAWSQDILGVGGAGGQANRAAAAQKTPVVKPADALPGATARAPAAPATKTVGDLQPNDALFDAINRGDIAAARDALNRGADLDATNVLGMTPMELSVDLSRNDITFLLLSMRGEDSGRGSRALGRDTASSGKTAPPSKTALSGKPAPSRRAAPARAIASAPAAVRSPSRYANDGGTPLPNAGFLGFGSRSASN